jgi:hypothetical protein
MTLETLIVVASVIATTISLTVTVAVLLRLRRRPQLRIREELRPNRRRGLVLLIGPLKGASSAAIEYHLPVLQHCWLVGTKESSHTAQQLANSYSNITFHWQEDIYLVDPDLLTSTYSSVSHILDIERPRMGIEFSEVIADVTGGLKPMTAGLTAACVERQCNMQYMKAPRDENGAIISGGVPEPIRIDISF